MIFYTHFNSTISEGYHAGELKILKKGRQRKAFENLSSCQVKHNSSASQQTKSARVGAAIENQCVYTDEILYLYSNNMILRVIWD